MGRRGTAARWQRLAAARPRPRAAPTLPPSRLARPCPPCSAPCTEGRGTHQAGPHVLVEAQLGVGACRRRLLAKARQQLGVGDERRVHRRRGDLRGGWGEGKGSARTRGRLVSRRSDPSRMHTCMPLIDCLHAQLGTLALRAKGAAQDGGEHEVERLCAVPAKGGMGWQARRRVSVRRWHAAACTLGTHSHACRQAGTCSARDTHLLSTSKSFKPAPEPVAWRSPCSSAPRDCRRLAAAAGGFGGGPREAAV